MKMKKTKPQVIGIAGKRWFQRGPGNTYNTVTITVDREVVATLPKEYGYGDSYKDRAQHWLKANGYLPRMRKYTHGGYEALWQYCDRRGIMLLCLVSDVPREKDL